MRINSKSASPANAIIETWPAANDLSGNWARAWLVSGRGLLREWRRRYRSRRELRALSAYQIRDFCLDPMAAEREAAKPFWRA